MYNLLILLRVYTYEHCKRPLGPYVAK